VVVTLEPVTDLPKLLLTPLVEESLAQGFRAIDRLVDEWQTGKNRFSKPGEVLFLAWFADQVIGVCGLNQDPYADFEQVAASMCSKRIGGKELGDCWLSK